MSSDMRSVPDLESLFTDLESATDEHGGRFTHLVPAQVQYLDRIVRSYA